MNSVLGLTDGSMSGGIYTVQGSVPLIMTAVTDAGWAAAVVEPAERTAELYDHLGTALDLPDWFGRNLDALWDVITDLERPTVLIMDDWTRYARARPERWQLIMDLFAERCARTPPFAVVLASPEPWEPEPLADTAREDPAEETSWNSD